ncbi:MAG: restriction endonuclease subunit S [Desulfobulbaceae bacterium]|nr:MAG: restriction endonuclease subunit S [Desulfobulbaceae bacterium]
MRAGRYRKYPEFKDSKIEWVGEIPSWWDVKPLFSTVITDTEKNFNGYETNVLSLSYGNIVKRDVEANFGLLPESFNTYQLIGPGDLVLRLTDLQNDKRSLRVGFAKEKGIITSAYLKLIAKSGEFDSRFLYRLLHSYDTTKVFYGMGGGLRQSMKFEDMRRLPVLVPPLDEQSKIAYFLDHETTNIDTLIDKQQQLIALLKEKRQAVISHAVTKGLNPDAPMKDSGVEWLGDVPEHWTTPALGYCAKISTGATPNRSENAYWGGNIPWVKTGEVRYNDIFETEEYITPTGLANSSVAISPPGTLLMAMYGQGVTRGRVAILGVEATYNQACAAIIPDGKILNRYLRYFFIAAYHAIRDGGNETSQMNLNADIVGKFKIIVPTLEEQNEIVRYLDDTLKRYESLLQKSEEAISYILERRTALISAAVTGKIDVRDWQPPPCNPSTS